MKSSKRTLMISGMTALSAGLLFQPVVKTGHAQQNDSALVAKAKLIHSHVLKLDTHNDIEPSNFTADCNYTMKLATQVNIPKMVEGGMDVSFMIVYVGQGPLTPEALRRIFERIIDEMRTIQRQRMQPGGEK